MTIKVNYIRKQGYCIYEINRLCCGLITGQMIEAARIAVPRTDKGWKQEDLARAARIGIGTLVRIENDYGKPREGTLLKILKALKRAKVTIIDEKDHWGLRVER